MSKIEGTYIPAGHYISVAQAMEYLDKSRSLVQYHIKEGNIKTIHMPGLGHHIRKEDIELFVARSPGKPSIYEKVK